MVFCQPVAESSRAQFHLSTWRQSIKAYPDTPSASVFPCQSLVNIHNNASGSGSLGTSTGCQEVCGLMLFSFRILLQWWKIDSSYHKGFVITSQFNWALKLNWFLFLPQ